MRTVLLIKLKNLRKILITHHRMPNGIYACILTQACSKSPERAWNLLENNFHFY